MTGVSFRGFSFFASAQETDLLPFLLLAGRGRAKKTHYLPRGCYQIPGLPLFFPCRGGVHGKSEDGRLREKNFFSPP